MVVAALASLASGVALRADILTLANGDKLKGTLVSNTNGVIKFKSPALGEITVPATKATVKVDPPPPAAVPDPPSLATSAADEAAAQAVAARDPQKTTPTPAPKPTPPPKPKRKIRLSPFPTLAGVRDFANDPDKASKVNDTGWFNQISLGLVSQAGRTRGLNIDLRTENEFRTPLTSTRLQNRYLYGRASGVTSADAISSTLRFRRTLTRRLFLQSNTRYDRNTITLMQCDAEQGLGIGINLKASQTLVLAAGTEAAVRYRSYLPPSPAKPAEPHNLSSVINIFQDMTLGISPRFSLTQNFIAMVAPSNDNDYRLNFNAGVTGRMTDTLRVTTRVELEYDRSLPPELRYNQRITTSLGYVF